MQELTMSEIEQVNGGLPPVAVAWAVVEIAAGLGGIFSGGWALGHFLYSQK